MAHSLIAGPVVLCAVDLGVVEGRIHPAVDHLHRLCTEVLYHLAHQIRLLHPEGQPHEICQRLHLFAGVEAADPGVEPRQPHKVHRAEAGEEPIPDLAVQHPPHLRGVGVEERQLQNAQGGQLLRQLAQGDAGKVNAAILHLLDDALLGPQPASAVDDDLDPPLRPLGHKVGDRVTVVLNGQKVVDNVMLENFWDRSQPIFPIEQIELQAHGTKVYFRNLYINELPQIEPTKLSAEEQKEGFRLLYDGTNMHGWIGNTRDYVSENGAIALYPGNGGGGNLYTKEEFGDFVLRFEFQLTEGANNGIGIRTPLEGDAAYVGMEIQVLDNEAPIYSQLEKYQYHGSVYGVLAAKRGFLKPVGEWNTEEIWIKGDDIRVTLNGTVITEGNIAEASKNGTLDHRDHPGLQNKKGHIGFLGHGSLVKFKNIRIKEL